MDEHPSVALEALHDETFAAKQANAQLALKRNAEADAFGGDQERVFLRDQLAADFREMNGNDLARIRRAERYLLLAARTVLKHRHEERLSREQALACSDERAEKTSALLCRSVAKDGFHLDAVLHV